LLLLEFVIYRKEIIKKKYLSFYEKDGKKLSNCNLMRTLGDERKVEFELEYSNAYSDSEIKHHSTHDDIEEFSQQKMPNFVVSSNNCNT